MKRKSYRLLLILLVLCCALSTLQARHPGDITSITAVHSSPLHPPRYPTPTDTTRIDTLLCPNQSITLNGAEYNEAGEYIVHLTSANGNDSIVQLVIAFRPEIPPIYIITSVCQVEPYISEGYTAHGFYIAPDIIASNTYYTQTIHTTTPDGCDSMTTLYLTINPTKHRTIYDTICKGASYNNYGFEIATFETQYSTSLTRTRRNIARNGCDSVTTLQLTILAPALTTLRDTIIENQLPYVWNHTTFYQADTLTATLTSSQGCDSIVTMMLHVLYNVKDTIIDTLCERQLPYIWNDSIFYRNDTITTRLPTERGVDSLLTMILLTGSDYFVTLHDTIGEHELPYIWRYHEGYAHAFLRESTYTDTIPTHFGCDSVIQLHLVTIANRHDTIRDTICSNLLPHPFGPFLFTTAGEKVDSTIGQYGETLYYHYMLFTYDAALVEGTVIYDTLCAGEPYHHAGFNIDAEETQHVQNITKLRTETTQWGCDSTITLLLTLLPHSYATLHDTILEEELPYTLLGETFYTAVEEVRIVTTNSQGCDSIITFSLVVRYNTTQTKDTTLCRNQLPYNWAGHLFFDAGVWTDTTTNPDGSYCYTTYQLQVYELPTIYAITGYTLPICPSTQTVTLHAEVGGGIPPYRYHWNSEQLQHSNEEVATLHIADISCDSSIIVTLTISDSVGCVVGDAAILQVEDTIRPIVRTQLSAQQAVAEQCNFVTPDVTTLVRAIVSDNCTSHAALVITQVPIAGSALSADTNLVVTILDACDNATHITVPIRVAQPLAISPTITPALCANDANGAISLSLSGGTSPFQYEWKNEAGDVIGTSTTLTNLTAGSYSIVITDSNNCIRTATYRVEHTYEPMIAGEITPHQSVCWGDSVQNLTGTAASGGKDSYYQWQCATDGTHFIPADGVYNTQNYTFDAVPTNTCYYRRAWISAQCGITYSDTLAVHILPTYHDTLYGQVCQGYSYQQQDFMLDSNQTDSTGTIEITQHLATRTGCDSLRTLILTILPITYDTLHTAVCQGEGFHGWGFELDPETLSEAGTFAFTNTFTSAITNCDSLVTLWVTVLPYHHTALEETICEGNGYVGHGFRITPEESIGVEEIVKEQHLTTLEGCDSTITLTLTILDTAIRIENLSTDFCDNYSATLQVTSDLNELVWSNGMMGETIVVEKPGTYVVTGRREGCAATASIRVEGCAFTLYLPNSITATRADGLNDYFAIPDYNQQMIIAFEIWIYSRWGELIFHSQDKHFQWYGDHNGRIFHNVAYNYVIICTDQSGKKHMIKGSITVL